MQLANSNTETSSNSLSNISDNITDLNYDFYLQLQQLTKNITPARLQILREYVARLSPDTQSRSGGRKRAALSARETEVLVLVTNGYNRKDIGTTLGISKNTAARHIANIYHKLGISCVAEATHYALTHNIIGETKLKKPGSN